MQAATVAAVERMRRAAPWRVDAVLASCFVVVGLATTAHPDQRYASRDATAVALVLAATVPYYLRRRAPVAVLVVTTAAVAALFIADYDAGALPIVLGVGVYTVGAYRPVRDLLLVAVFMVTTFVVMVAADSATYGGSELMTSVTAYGATMLLGWSMQSRRLRLDALEREHGEAARRSAADERLRIAQELHDVVAHSMGVIAVQAGVGMHVIDSDPAEAKRALEHISTTSRSSLTEIRRLLGLVRGGPGADAYAPTPGLADLPRLVREVGAGGLQVDLDVGDGAANLPPGVELVGYRIVQEALTNARRHGHADHATVRLEVVDGRLRVVISDDGSGVTGSAGYRSGPGHGLIGMRERVAVYGGALHVGPSPHGGFNVDATIPFEHDPQGER